MKRLSQKQILQNLELQNEASTKTAHANAPFLSVDFGEKFSGLAFSPDGICVLPVGIFSSEKIDDEIYQQCKNRTIKTVIIGLPKSDNGPMTAWEKEVRQHGNLLKKLAHVIFVNERGSSGQASHTAPSHERADDKAAMHILEYFLAQKEPS